MGWYMGYTVCVSMVNSMVYRFRIREQYEYNGTASHK